MESLCLEPRRMVPGHRVTLLSSAVAYPAMLEAIAAAREEVLLETYIWADDLNGRRFADAVCIKAQEGVRVRCVVDGAGSFGFPGHTVGRLREAGAGLSVFHPVGPWRARWGWQVRDHRKLLVVDGRIAFVGGMNLGDNYAPRAWSGQEWNDVQARVEGPAVRDLVHLFEVTWRHAALETAPRIEKHAQTALLPIHGATTRAQALAVGKRLAGRKQIARHLQHAIGAARDRIWIQAAYFVPNRALRNALSQAARRGVDVRLMLPRNNDVPFLRDASRATWAPLLRRGVQILEWLPGMLHAKVATVDGAWSVVGSYNLDSRSLYYNWEVALEILDRDVARDLEEKFSADAMRCERVDGDAFRKRGLWQRLRERFFHAFRMWL